MFLRAHAFRLLPHNGTDLARRGCQLTTFFAIQGAIVLGFYLVAGPPADLERLPLGFQLDPIHAAVHLAVGLVGGYVGFLRPSAAMRFLQVFGILYLGLAILGTFTSTHFGMHLEFNENVLHWTVGVLAVVVGFGLLPIPTLREDVP
jgi:hypothetical protein